MFVLNHIFSPEISECEHKCVDTIVCSAGQTAHTLCTEDPELGFNTEWFAAVMCSYSASWSSPFIKIPSVPPEVCIWQRQIVEMHHAQRHLVEGQGASRTQGRIRQDSVSVLGWK